MKYIQNSRTTMTHLGVLFISFVCKVAKSVNYARNICLYVHPHEGTGRMFIKFDILVFSKLRRENSSCIKIL
jgi:hypothetical protein